MELNNGATPQMNTPVTEGDYTMSGAETEEVRFNILINNAEKTGQFAVVYFDSLDYMYEFTFNLDDVETDISNPNFDFDAIQAYCFDNESHWREVYLPASVTVIETNPNQPQPAAVDPNITYFNNWLRDKYGNTYYGKILSARTHNDTVMYLKSSFDIQTFRDRSYLLAQTMTVVGFVTSILGLAAGASAVAVIGAITGTGGMLTMGQSVYIYELRANWFKYVTAVGGAGYPYGLTDRYTYFDGYCYTGTGTCNVDEASASTSYSPSAAVYNSDTNVYNRAFDQYDSIGFQEGNFP